MCKHRCRPDGCIKELRDCGIEQGSVYKQKQIMKRYQKTGMVNLSSFAGSYTCPGAKNPWICQ